jgi:hypothetical protein
VPIGSDGGKELIELASQLRRPDPHRRPISLWSPRSSPSEASFHRGGKPYLPPAIASMLGE